MSIIGLPAAAERQFFQYFVDNKYTNVAPVTVGVHVDPGHGEQPPAAGMLGSVIVYGIPIMSRKLWPNSLPMGPKLIQQNVVSGDGETVAALIVAMTTVKTNSLANIVEALSDFNVCRGGITLYRERMDQ